ANGHGVLTWVEGGNGTFMEPPKREYVLATYLLVRAGDSVVGDLNAVRTWWPALTIDLGEPRGDFYCLDPGAGFARAEPCPAAGRGVGRHFARARVLVNPGDATLRVPLGAPYRELEGGPVADPLVLGPHQGRVLVGDAHTASRTSSGLAGR